MSHPGHSVETHSPHWSADIRDELIKKDTEMIHISAKAMDIIWGNDQRFWRWVKLTKDESRFEVGVELVQVNWIEVTGSLDLAKFALSPSITYEIFYIFKFKVDAFGWHSCPITFEVITPDGKKSKRSEILESYRNKVNQWHEFHGGEFILNSDMKGRVKFGMFEVQTDWWKGGMIFQGVIIRPKLV